MVCHWLIMYYICSIHNSWTFLRFIILKPQISLDLTEILCDRPKPSGHFVDISYLS